MDNGKLNKEINDMVKINVTLGIDDINTLIDVIEAYQCEYGSQHWELIQTLEDALEGKDEEK